MRFLLCTVVILFIGCKAPKSPPPPVAPDIINDITPDPFVPIPDPIPQPSPDPVKPKQIMPTWGPPPGDGWKPVSPSPENPKGYWKKDILPEAPRQFIPNAQPLQSVGTWNLAASSGSVYYGGTTSYSNCSPRG